MRRNPYAATHAWQRRANLGMTEAECETQCTDAANLVGQIALRKGAGIGFVIGVVGGGLIGFLVWGRKKR